VFNKGDFMKSVYDIFPKQEIQRIKKELKINSRMRVLSVSHNDLDGVGCAIEINNVFESVRYSRVTYSNVDSVLGKIDYDEYDLVLLTDISPKHESSLDISDKIIMIDHHETALKYNNHSKNRFVDTSYCGSALTKWFVEVLFDIRLKHLNNLMYLINDYDLWIHEDEKSKQLNELYFKYWDDNFIHRFSNGDTEFLPDEIHFLKERKKKYHEIMKTTNFYDLEKINGCLFMLSDFVNDVAEKLLKDHGYRVVINKNPKSGSCSLRSNLEKDYPDFHLGKFLENLGYGGGHRSAGGLSESDPIKFKEKIKDIEDKLFDMYPIIRN
jgi:oligoribonuclease NrnB/cAMP/cGMP phosphodiesterase (DHH superfamily)